MNRDMMLIYLEELVDGKTFSFISLKPVYLFGIGDEIEWWKDRTIKVCLENILNG